MAGTHLWIDDQLALPLEEVEIRATGAGGPGGQNINKVATAIQLRFDPQASSLPQAYKEGFRNLRDRRVTRNGLVVIKAQRYRTQSQNRADALERLRLLIQQARPRPTPPRRPMRRSRGAERRRLEGKKERGRKKALRKPPSGN